MSHAVRGEYRILPHRWSAVAPRGSTSSVARYSRPRPLGPVGDPPIGRRRLHPHCWGGTRGDLHFSPVDHRLIPGAPGGDRRPSERRRVSSRQKKIPGFRRWSCTAARTEDSPGARAGAGGGIRGPWAPDPSSRASPAIRRQAGAHGAGPARSLDRWGDAPREARGLV